MAGPPLDQELAEQAASAYREDGFRIFQARANAMGLPLNTYKSRVKVAASRGLLLDKPPALPGYQLSKITTVKDQDGQTIREFIQQKPEHGDTFEVPAGHTVKGVSALVGADGRTIQQWIKTKEQTQLDLIAAIKDEFSQYKGVAKLVKPPKETFSDLMQIYPVTDPHLGMLAWGPETGESNDLKIGVDRLEGGLNRLISLSPAAETAAIINTGDYFHADDQRNVTPTSGHPLDVDGRGQKVRWAGVKLLRTSIDFALQRHQTVIVKNLKGNHDPESAAWLNIALGLFYSNESRVKIDLDDGNNDIWLGQLNDPRFSLRQV